jgi:hypothetical protein
VRGLHSALTRLRQSVDERVTPKVKQSVAAVLDEQRREIIFRAKAAAAHLMEHPRDTSVYWDEAKWDRKMLAAMKPHLYGMAEQVDAHIKQALGVTAKAGPIAAVNHALTRGATRITRLNARTRDAVVSTVRETVASGIRDGLSPAEVGDALEAALEDVTLDNGTAAFDEYRAELIARTEMMASYNDATLGSYQDADITMVEAIDGDEDEECIDRVARNPYTLEEADAEEDHPNGTLDWLPVIGDE